MKPVVFISWSWDRARHVAEGLHELIGDCIQLVEPFMSEEDLEAGRRWSPAIARMLDRSNFGIIVLTPESQHRPWVMFEAGALSKQMEQSLVVPYLVGMDVAELTGPLVDFHAYVATDEKAKECTWKLLGQINDQLGEKALPKERLQRVFERFWPDMEKRLKTLPPKPPTGTPVPARTDHDVLSEILLSVRRLERQTREPTGASVSDDVVRATMAAEAARQAWMAAQARVSSLEREMEDEIDPGLQEEMRARLNRAVEELDEAKRALLRAQLVRNTVANGAALAPPLRR